MTSSSDRPSRRRRSWRGCALALALLSSIPPAPALAQSGPSDSPSDPKEMARRLGEEALALHEQGRFADSYEKFDRAERIAHSPVFLVWMARSKRATGNLLAAKELYGRVSAESLPEDASPNWVKARSDAKAELAALDARIPRLTVRLVGKPPSDARIEVDGKHVAAGEKVDVDPGDHVVRASAQGVAPVERRVRAEEGTSPPPLEIELAATPRPAGSSKGPALPGVIALGVGAAALAAGGVTGGYALALAGDVKDGCVGDKCLKSDEGKAGDADTLAKLSTGLFIGGAAVAIAGVVLLVVRPGGSAAVGVGRGGTRIAWRF